MQDMKHTDKIPEIKVSWFERWRRRMREFRNITMLQSFIAQVLPPGVKLVDLVKRFGVVEKNIPCAHDSSHVLKFILDMLRAPREQEGCFVEAGCFKGGSTAKFSIIAKILGKKLIVFDSFEGLPENGEQHEKSLEGHSIQNWFDGGAFTGTLEEVKSNISRYGEIDSCEFVRGWFEKTMVEFNTPVLAGFIDVDLASSTKTCLKYLYPLLVHGGVLCSQDGDFPLVVEVFQDKSFLRELGEPFPVIEGLGEKITHIRKP